MFLQNFQFNLNVIEFDFDTDVDADVVVVPHFRLLLRIRTWYPASDADGRAGHKNS